jgi:molybdenum cofactor biosynthesis enzyme MoaA
MDLSPTYCENIYKNLYIERAANGQFRVGSCCFNRPGPAIDRVDFFNDDYLRSQRAGIQQGEKVPGCVVCWNEESTGTSIFRAKDPLHPDPYRPLLLGIDYNVEPICNARCIMCSSYYSSAWAAEDEKFGQSADRKFFDIKSKSLDLDLDFSHLQKIYFNGGEPLLSNDFSMMLDKIYKSQGGLSQVDVSFNTNGSVFPDQGVVDLLDQARSVLINLSIDATGREFEYIRYPLEWASIVENTEKFSTFLKNNHKVSIRITANVGIHNVLEIPSLQSWAAGMKRISPRLQDVGLAPTLGKLSFDSTSTELKNILLETVQDDNIRSWIKNSQPSADTWRPWLEEIDQRRSLRWQERLSKLFQTYEKITTVNTAVKYS